EFYALCFRTWGLRRNSNGGGTVARGIGKIHRRFESGDEPLVAVRGWICQAGERGSVFQNSADEKQRKFGKPGVTVSSKERFALFPKRHVGMHAAAVVSEDWFRHERDRFVVAVGDVAQDVFVILHVVAHAFYRRETNVDLGLTCRCDFVMLALDRDP